MAHTYDVVVIGGGASGMMAALVAAERGKSVLLLEKNKQLGKKLAITGGGRCNILSAEPDTRTLLRQYGAAEQFLYSPFVQFGMQKTWDFFQDRGLPLVVEAKQRAFPQTQRAADVVAFFLRQLKRAGVTIETGVTVQALEYTAGAVQAVRTTHGVYRATAYIIATGGLSHPETGSTGDGLSWLAASGHTVQHPNPSLVPLVTADAWVHALAGTALDQARLTFTGADGTHVQSEVGRILFTHFGLSGPVTLQVAGAVVPLLQSGPVSATIDLFPGVDDAVLQQRVQAVFAAHQNKVVKNVLKEIVPAGLSTAVAGRLPVGLAAEKVHSVTRDARQTLIQTLRALPCTVTGSKGHEWSIVSDGGVSLTDIDTKTMRSRHVPNLFVTGDALHISRPSGGYSLQLCWTTGYVAGQSV